MTMSLAVAISLVLSTQTAPEQTPGSVALLSLKPAAETEAALKSAIASSNPEVRAVAARVVAFADRRTLVQSVFDALTTEQHVVAATEQIRAILLMGGAPVIPRLEPHANRLGPDTLAVIAEWQRRQITAGPDAPRPAASARTLDLWIPGLLASTAAAAGCKPDERMPMAFAQATYAADGRPVQLALDSRGLSGACRNVLDALARLSFGEGARTIAEGQKQWLVLPLTPAYVACTSSREPLPVHLSPGDPLKKTKNVAPFYPPAAQRAETEGMVIVEAQISLRGCVRSATVLKSVDPLLDVPAVVAVLQWEFDPKSVNRGATPLIAIMSVSYTMR